MRCHKQAAHFGEIAAPACLDEVEHSLIFGEYVPGPALRYWIVDQLKLVEGRFPQAGHIRMAFADAFDRSPALGHALAIGRLA